MIFFPITNKIIDVKDYLATRSFVLFVQPNNVLLKNERQKEHSTDRQTQPIRQTGSRSSLFFSLLIQEDGQEDIEKDFSHFYRTQMQYFLLLLRMLSE
jgi:hypothetical protein